MNKKILLISSSYFGQVQGGAEYQQFLIGEYLRKKGYEIYYIFIDNSDEIKQISDFHLRSIKKKVLLKKIFGNYFFLDALKVYAVLKEIKPDYIIARTGFSYVGIAAKFCENYNCKLIWNIAHINDITRDDFKFRHFFNYIDKKILEYGIKKANYIIGQAEYQNQLLIKNYGRKCDIIMSNFHPLPDQSLQKEHPIKIVWIANFKKWKNPEIFIDLAQKFIGSEDLKFIMIGRIDDTRWGRSIIKKIQNQKNVKYLGELPIEVVNEILSQAHIFVHTSQYEGFPNTFIQAMMRKVPIVSLNVDPDDILKKNKIGFHSINFDQMVKDVNLLIEDKNKRNDMAEAAQKYGFKNHSSSNIEKLIEIIKNQ